MPRPVLAGRLAALALAVMLAACASPPVQRDASLYRALGETEGIDRLVQALLDRCYADDRIAFLFENADRRDLHRLIAEQFCQESGGPCTYTGRSMAEAHSGLGITHTDFDAFVEVFTDAMEDVDLPYPVQNRMLAIFAPMHAEVVDR